MKLSWGGTASMSSGARAGWGVLLLSFAVLLNELLLTRIFSVVSWYQFSFLVVSIAMMGMTSGSMAVALCPAGWLKARGPALLSGSLLGLALTAFAAAFLQTTVKGLASDPFSQPLTALLTVGLQMMPFFAGGFGLSLALALAGNRNELGRLYALDLTGAALACPAFVVLLSWVDGLTAILVVCLVSAAAAAFLARDFARPAKIVALAALVGIVVNTARPSLGLPKWKITWTKGAREESTLLERWNFFSRIRVAGDRDGLSFPLSCGFGARVAPDLRIHQVNLIIDGAASSALSGFHGNLGDFGFLKEDVSNLAHALRHDRDALVIGSGGGRDVLSALVFGQRSVTGLEINPLIERTLNEDYGEFTGHLDRDPRVKLIVDEARSHLSTDPSRYGVIQIPLVDTWAASATMAYALTENRLYTVEGWRIFLSRLEPDGILSVTRWFSPEDRVEVYRLLSLARSALHQIGVPDLDRHLLLATNEKCGDKPGLATLLLTPSPFSDSDVATFREWLGREGFVPLILPGYAYDPTMAALLSPSDEHAAAAVATSGLDISAPTDDRPFFFLFDRLSVFPSLLAPHAWFASPSTFLSGILAVVLFFSLIFIGLPLLALVRSGPRPSLLSQTHFSLIGIGFMMIEISMIQRLSVLLGHPAYGFTVTLFSILLSSGAGSLAFSRLDARAVRRWWLFFLALLFAIGVSAGRWVHIGEGAGPGLRIAMAIALLSPLGFCMGTFFPAGIAWYGVRHPRLVAFSWGVNGAFSVAASVLATIISVGWGISCAFWAGAACYAVVVALLALASGGETTAEHAASS